MNKMIGHSKKIPLMIIFVWHPFDKAIVKPIVDHCMQLLSRDRSKMFSRAINVPIRFCTSLNDLNVPTFLPNFNQAEKILIFSFVGKYVISTGHLSENMNWVDYIRRNFINISNQNVEHIGIALDETGYKLDSEKNFIRMKDFYSDERGKHQLFLSIAHQIYQCCLSTKKLTIFLSHTKADDCALNFAKATRAYIDTHTNIQKFFDVTSIEPGANFAKRIIEGIQDTTVLIVKSDHYSSSYWCQQEVLLAKEKNCPMVVVDMLEEYEDRSFPYLHNCPVLRVNPSHGEIDILKVLSEVLIESIRWNFVYYQYGNGIDSNHIFFPRPPELMDTVRCKKRSISAIYPYPDVYEGEGNILQKAFKDITTPFSLPEDIKDKVIGISISDPLENEKIAAGIENVHLYLLSTELAGFFMKNGAIVVYGGDFRENGFTRFLCEEAKIQKNRWRASNPRCRNYTAWPIYLLSDIDVAKWKADCYDIIDLLELPPAKDVNNLISNPKKFLLADTSENQYIWSRCLTFMREEMIKHCDVRICAGGKSSNYRGIMPGVLEEILIAIKQRKPIYLMGGFGGITARICDFIRGEGMPKELTYEWQEKNLPEYEMLKNTFKKYGKTFVNYEYLPNLLKIENLNNGLNYENNLQLFSTISVDNGIALIMKGLENLRNMKKSKSTSK